MHALEPLSDSIDFATRQPRPISHVMTEVLARYGLHECPQAVMPVQGLKPRQCVSRYNAVPTRKANPLLSAAHAHRRLTA
jgi:hypothetical protein